jgi:hypothetical protein
MELWRRAGPFAVFTALALLYFAPVLWEDRMLAPGDGYFYYYPVRVALQQTLASHHLPLWNPSVYGGFPAAADPQVGVFFPLTWLFLVLPPSMAMDLLVLSSYILAGAFTVLYARAVGMDEWGAYAAGLIFAFGGFMVAHLGHLTMITAAPWLPLVLYCLEQLRASDRRWYRYVICGVAACAASILAGHPQISAYTLLTALLYLLFSGLIEHPPVGRVRFLLTGTLIFLLGFCLTAVQVLPTRELGTQSIRETMTYGFFTSFSLPVSHLLLLLFPYLFGWNTPYEAYGAYHIPPYRTPWWGAWNFTELTGYIGIAPLILSVAVAPLARRGRPIVFWLTAAVITLLYALGGNTPLASVAYHIPGLNLFRAPARILVVWNFAVALLAGFAITLLPRLASDQRKRLSAFGIGSILVPLLGFWIGFPFIQDRVIRLVTSNPGASLPPDPLTLLSWPLAIPVIMGLLGAVAILGLACKPSVVTRSLLLGVIGLDLTLFGHELEWRHASPTAEAESMPAALRTLREIDPLLPQSRILSVEKGDKTQGRLKDWALHPNRLMLHGIRNISGEDPLVTARYMNLVSDDAVLPVGASRALDLLSVRYLLISTARLTPSTLTQVGTFRFASTPLARSLIPSVPRREFWLGGVSATAIALISSMGGSLAIQDGQPVAKITIFTDGGRRIERLVRAGHDTAEWAWERPDVTPLVRHRKATIAEDLPPAPSQTTHFTGHRYLAVFPLGERVSVKRIVFDYLVPESSLNLYRLSFFDATTQASSPVTLLHEALGEPDRWQERLFSDGVGIFENRKALPRAWLASQVLSLTQAQVLHTIQTGRLPDGQPFDPRHTALIEEGKSLDFGPLDPVKVKAEVADEGPNRLTVVMVSDRPAFLILSEVFLPGWTATLDGAQVAINRTNYLLRGLLVPAGSHQIRFVYTPPGIARGMLISIGALVVLCGMAWADRWPIRQERDDPLRLKDFS